MTDVTAPAGFDSARHAEYSRLRKALDQRLQEGDAAALDLAQAEVERTWACRFDDPARVDALEMLTRVHLLARRFLQASTWSAEVVRLRRAAVPPDPLLLAMALGLDATVDFGLERIEAADAKFRESIACYDEALPAADLRRAQVLENYAEIVQRGFGRERYVTELLRQALAVRDADGRTPPGKLSERLVQLAMGELAAGEFARADQHLERAIGLSTTASSPPHGNDTLRAMRVQALVLRGGLAARLAQRKRVRRCMAAAREVRFDDEAVRLEMQFTVDEADGMQLEMLGERAAATDVQWQLVEAMQAHQTLFDSGTLDADWQADHWLRLADLLVLGAGASGAGPGADDNLATAEMLLDLARPRLEESSAWLFVRAEHHRRCGRGAEAVAAYQSALRLRKESAAEMSVLFGTSRRAVGAAGAAEFGGEPGDGLTFGAASVLVPGGMFGTESWLAPAATPPLPVGKATDAARLLLRHKCELGPLEFEARIGAKGRAGHLYGGAVLVFVHGFNVSFDDALRRGAQLMRDLNFDATLAVFSWPSRGVFWRYGSDRVSADAAADRLVEFLDRLASIDPDGPLHVVAHSMGNRVLLPALATIAGRGAGAVHDRLGEVVLAAPAVPEREFAIWLDAIAKSACPARFTLYASTADKAMWVGYLREGGSTLAGFARSGAPLLHPHVQTIDITGAASGEWLNLNHDVFASNPVMTEDIRQLLQLGSCRPPEVRLPNVLQKCRAAGEPPFFWAYEPIPIAAAPATSSTSH